jgi:hypothetical protein
MVLWTDFLALALVTLVLVLVPRVWKVPEAPQALRVVLRALPVLVGALWVALALLWRAQ